jgi:hypothetical protein
MLDTPVTIRFAHSLDEAAALAALAQLDSAEPLVLPVIVAERDGELRAALSLSDASVIADPFHPTAELLDLLRIRAQQLAAKPDRGRLNALKAALASALPRARAA